MKKSKIFISLVAFLMLGLISAYGQKSRLIVQSSDTLTFLMVVNGKQVNDSAKSKVSRVSDPGEVLIDLILNDSTKSHVSTSVYLSEQKEITYELRKLRGKYKLLPFSEIEWKSPEMIASGDSTITAVDSLSADNMAIDSANVYRGRKGCEVQASDRKVRDLVEEMNEAFFESQKKELAIHFVRNKCVNTDQLSRILKKISYEDVRLEILKNANIYDIDNFNDLRRLFLLDSMKTAFDNIAATTG